MRQHQTISSSSLVAVHEYLLIHHLSFPQPLYHRRDRLGHLHRRLSKLIYPPHHHRGSFFWLCLLIMKNVFFQSILLLAFIATTLSRPPSPRLEPRNQKFCPNPAIRVSWSVSPAHTTPRYGGSRRSNWRLTKFPSLHRSSFNQGQKQAMKDAIKCLMKAPTKMKYPGAVTRYDDLVSPFEVAKT